MSQLRIRTKGFKEIKLNVVSFMSPIFASTSSTQTQSSQQHHPIRTQQPNIRFDVQFNSQKAFEEWQTFVRSIQLKLLKGKDPNDVAVVTLWWPERDIRNWQGIIKDAEGGAERFKWAPFTVVEVELTKGIVAQGSALAFSFASDFDSIFGGVQNTIPSADRLITTPDAVTPPLIGSSLDADARAQGQQITPGSTAPTPSSTGPGGSVSSLFGNGI